MTVTLVPPTSRPRALTTRPLPRELRRSTLVRGHDRQDLLDPLAWLEHLGEPRPFLAKRRNDCLVLAVNHLGSQPQCGDALRHVINLSHRRI